MTQLNSTTSRQQRRAAIMLAGVCSLGIIGSTNHRISIVSAFAPVLSPARPFRASPPCLRPDSRVVARMPTTIRHISHISPTNKQRQLQTTTCTSTASAAADDETVQRSLLETRLELERKAKRTSFIQHIRTIFSASLVGARYAASRSWWCFPFLLTVYPLFYFLAAGKPATSPAFWSMPVLSSLIHSPSAGVIITGFLLSNISYFLSGLYLLDLIPDVRWAIPSRRKLTEKKEMGPGFSENPLLGTLILLCGVCSCLYHTFQTIGPQYHSIAETFFYIDHGFAISSILYFLNLCGVPGKRTLALGTTGLVLLATGSIRGAETYAFIHSFWHFFSAGASVSWAHDGLEKKRANVGGGGGK